MRPVKAVDRLVDLRRDLRRARPRRDAPAAAVVERREVREVRRSSSRTSVIRCGREHDVGVVGRGRFRRHRHVGGAQRARAQQQAAQRADQRRKLEERHVTGDRGDPVAIGDRELGMRPRRERRDDMRLDEIVQRPAGTLVVRIEQIEQIERQQPEIGLGDDVRVSLGPCRGSVTVTLQATDAGGGQNGAEPGVQRRLRLRARRGQAGVGRVEPHLRDAARRDGSASTPERGVRITSGSAGNLPFE